MLDEATLLKIMPHAKSRVQEFLEPLNAAMREFHINTPVRQAAFLAQIAHESGELRYVKELASGAAYEGRASLGNTQPGDGMKFKGRGLIQITGRNNYYECGKALGVDLITNPELLETNDLACRSAAWFWASRGLNDLADKGDINRICRRINGGLNGLSDRMAYYLKSCKALNYEPPKKL